MNDIKFDMEKINTDGNFREFIFSVRDEVDKMLNSGGEDTIPVTVKLNAQWHDFSDDPETTETSPLMVWADIKFGYTNFSLSDSEFRRAAGDKKKLGNLVTVRFTDALYSMEQVRENHLRLLRRLYSDWKTPDGYLH